MKMNRRLLQRIRKHAFHCVLIATWIAPAHAMEPAVGMVEQPCPPPVVLSPAVRNLLMGLFLESRTITASELEQSLRDRDLVAFNEANRKNSLQDWPGLCRYRSDNARVLAAPATPRVVFIGDSITENWVLAHPDFFDGGIVGRGISGQTTAQMLVRFRADVVALGPRVVHILGGTNDIAGNAGPTTAQDFKNQMMSMVEIAEANNIAVILGTIPPAAAFSWQPTARPAPRITELNTWLRTYAAQKRIEFIDYHSALVGTSGELRSDLGNDGVHPNRNGYAVMRRLVNEKLSVPAKAPSPSARPASAAAPKSH